MRPGITVMTWPVSPKTPPYTNGVAVAIPTSLMRNLVAGLSVPSITKSKRAKISRALSASSATGNFSISSAAIDLAQTARGSLDLELADIGAVINDLAREIGFFHRVRIHQAEPDTIDATRAGDRQRRRDSESADADNQYAVQYAVWVAHG